MFVMTESCLRSGLKPAQTPQRPHDLRAVKPRAGHANGGGGQLAVMVASMGMAFAWLSGAHEGRARQPWGEME